MYHSLRNRIDDAPETGIESGPLFYKDPSFFCRRDHHRIEARGLDTSIRLVYENRTPAKRCWYKKYFCYPNESILVIEPFQKDPFYLSGRAFFLFFRVPCVSAGYINHRVKEGHREGHPFLFYELSLAAVSPRFYFRFSGNNDERETGCNQFCEGKRSKRGWTLIHSRNRVKRVTPSRERNVF